MCCFRLVVNGKMIDLEIRLNNKATSDGEISSRRPSIVSAWDAENTKFQKPNIHSYARNDVQIWDIESNHNAKASLNESLAIDSPVQTRMARTQSEKSKSSDIGNQEIVNNTTQLNDSLNTSRSEQFRIKRSLFSHRYKRYSEVNATTQNVSTLSISHKGRNQVAVLLLFHEITL